jgi:hypothetical protein
MRNLAKMLTRTACILTYQSGIIWLVNLSEKRLGTKQSHAHMEGLMNGTRVCTEEIMPIARYIANVTRYRSGGRMEEGQPAI